MPVYNAERFLAEAIESILNQTFTDFELLIIDDASTDRSPEIIRSFKDPRIQLITHTKNQKLIATLNEGIEKARAPFVARMDADDISTKERLTLQYEFIIKHSDHVIVGSGMKIMNEAGTIVGEQPVFHHDAVLQRALSVTNIFPHGSVMFRKAAVIKSGGYRSQAYLVEDYDLWTRLAKQGKLANIPKPLYLWRQNPAGESLSKSAEQRRGLQQVRNTTWIAYGAEGPAPRRLWASLWPSDYKNVAEKRLFADLHIQFARGYHRHRERFTALQHILAAIKMIPQNPIYYGYLLMFIMPSAWFFSLEEQVFRLRQSKRGW